MSENIAWEWRGWEPDFYNNTFHSAIYRLCIGPGPPPGLFTVDSDLCRRVLRSPCLLVSLQRSLVHLQVQPLVLASIGNVLTESFSRPPPSKPRISSVALYRDGENCMGREVSIR
jgi:hypothetical protein